jgi:hypothetical protein
VVFKGPSETSVADRDSEQSAHRLAEDKALSVEANDFRHRQTILCARVNVVYSHMFYAYRLVCKCKYGEGTWSQALKRRINLRDSIGYTLAVEEIPWLHTLPRARVALFHMIPVWHSVTHYTNLAILIQPDRPRMPHNCSLCTLS